MVFSRISVLSLLASTMLGCSVSTTVPSDTRLADTIECAEPRPEICHKALRPVCATRDNGVRCVTTPCDSTDDVTYPNECLACQDPAVYYYRTGPCDPTGEG